MEENINNKKLTFEQIVAGALLKFTSVDILDLSMIMEQLETAGFVVPKEYDYKFPNIDGYIKCYDSGKIQLRSGVDMKKLVKGLDFSIEKLFENVIGAELIKFFGRDGYSVEFQGEKWKKMHEGKANLLADGKVLILSDEEHDYEWFERYGFKNITWFGSIMKADSYFSERFWELDKYQIIIIGGHIVIENFWDLPMTQKLKELKRKQKVLIAGFSGYLLEEGNMFYVSLDNYKSWRSWYMEETKLETAIDDIVMGAVVNGATENIKHTDFMPYETYSNVPLAPFPKRKAELKILYLDSVKVTNGAKEIAERFGLNVTFMSDNNSAFGKIARNLGEYDIIIGSEMFSKRIWMCSTECAWQCKYTGNPYVLLATYEENSLPLHSEDADVNEFVLGNKVSLKYVESGMLKHSDDLESVKFDVPSHGNSKDGEWEQYHQGELADLKAILEVTVRLYNDEVMRNGYDSLDVEGFKNAHEYDVATVEAFNAEKRRQEEALKPIRIIDEIKYYIETFMAYRKKSLIRDNVKGIVLSETEKGLRIECNLNGRVLSSLTISKNEDVVDNLRVFYIQFLTKKGKLCEAVMLGVYTDKFEQFSPTRRPEEQEWEVVMNIHKQVIKYLKPLVDEAVLKDEGKDLLFKRIDEK